MVKNEQPRIIFNGFSKIVFKTINFQVPEENEDYQQCLSGFWHIFLEQEFIRLILYLRFIENIIKTFFREIL